MTTLIDRPVQKAQTVAPKTPAVATHRSPWLAFGLVLIGVGLAAVALLGPAVTQLVDYRVSETLRNQTIGLDAVSLFGVAPLALIAAVLVLRGHVAGPALALGIGAYTSYMFVQYIVGPDYADLPGNNERLFPLCLLLFAAGWIVALAAWQAVAPPGSGRTGLLLQNTGTPCGTRSTDGTGRFCGATTVTGRSA
jgi:hypothetical protein